MAPSLKRLVLVRHAKSSWEHPGLSDHDRPLNGRGRRTAPAVALALAELGWAPDVVVCSTAERAQQTWARMAPELDPVELHLDADLYMGGIRAIRAAIAELDEAHHTAWLIGHNPGWELAADLLCDFGGPMKTADSVRMQCEVGSWAEAATQSQPWRFAGHLAARSVDPKGA